MSVSLPCVPYFTIIFVKYNHLFVFYFNIHFSAVRVLFFSYVLSAVVSFYLVRNFWGRGL